MPRIFPVLDSLLVGLAVLVLGGALARGFLADPWSAYPYVAGFAGLIFAALLWFGGRRGLENVDGVFMGRAPRFGALAALVAGGAVWALAPAPRAGKPPPSLEMSQAKASACDEKLLVAERLVLWVEAAQNKTSRVPLDEVSALRQANTGLFGCAGPKKDALAARLQKAAAATEIPQPLAESGDPTAARLLMLPQPPEGPEVPAPSPSEAADDPQDERGVVKNAPAMLIPKTDAAGKVEMTRVVYRREHRDGLLDEVFKLIGLGLGLGFGWTETSIREIREAYKTAAADPSGAALEAFFVRQEIPPGQRAQAILDLMAVEDLERAKGGREGAVALEAYMLRDKALAICYGVLRDTVGAPFEAQAIGATMDVLRHATSGLDEGERNALDDRVRACIARFSDGEEPLGYYARLAAGAAP